MAFASYESVEVVMDTLPESPRMFRCPRCQHTDYESMPPCSHCPRCGLAIPPPEREHFRASPELRLMVQEM
jgi:hypothetical protein